MIELAGIAPSQLGAMILSDLGADIVRIDKLGDVPGAIPDGPSREVLSRGRRSIALDLKQEHARRIALHLFADADVLIDGSRRC